MYAEQWEIGESPTGIHAGGNSVSDFMAIRWVRRVSLCLSDDPVCSREEGDISYSHQVANNNYALGRLS